MNYWILFIISMISVQTTIMHSMEADDPMDDELFSAANPALVLKQAVRNSPPSSPRSPLLITIQHSPKAKAPPAPASPRSSSASPLSPTRAHQTSSHFPTASSSPSLPLSPTHAAKISPLTPTSPRAPSFPSPSSTSLRPAPHSNSSMTPLLIASVRTHPNAQRTRPSRWNNCGNCCPSLWDWLMETCCKKHSPN